MRDRSLALQHQTNAALQQHLRILPRSRHNNGQSPLPRTASKAAALLDEAGPDLLAFTGFPKEHWRQVWSNNSLEWLNREIRRWASRYGIAFFEDRVDRGMNYNLTIEVGSMLMTGRRCALLKNKSIERLPTDLIGRIRKDVDLDDLSTVSEALHRWIRDDLGLGACDDCPA